MIGLSVNLGILSVVEGASIIIAACVVSIWPLVIRLIPRSILSALSCSTPRKHHHRDWYMASIQAQPKCQDGFVTCRQDHVQRDGIWSSEPSSLADLEDQRLWALNEDDIQPLQYEETVGRGS